MSQLDYTRPYTVRRPFNQSGAGRFYRGNANNWPLAAYTADGIPRLGWTFYPALLDLVRGGYLRTLLSWVPWEELAGTKNGTNRTFTTEHPPLGAAVFFAGQQTARLGISGSTVRLHPTLPAPDADDPLFVSYFWLDDSDPEVRYVFAEQLSGLDGSNKVFTLAHTPRGASAIVRWNGVAISDYSIVGTTLTLGTDQPAPDESEFLAASYCYDDAGAPRPALKFMELLAGTRNGANRVFSSQAAALSGGDVTLNGVAVYDLSIVGTTITLGIGVPAPTLEDELCMTSVA